MSVLWFIFIGIGLLSGIDVTDMEFIMMFALFYIGDCILISRKR